MRHRNASPFAKSARHLYSLRCRSFAPTYPLTHQMQYLAARADVAQLGKYRSRSRPPRRTSPLAFDRTQNNQALHVDATAGGGPSSDTSRRISAKRILGMATSAIWKPT